MTGGWEWVPEVLARFVTVHHLIAEPDMITAHAGAFGGGPGVIVIAGTGSIAYGKDAAGQQARAGGWGYAMGDEGSGYDLGRQALVAAARMEDGRGPKTSLRAALLNHLQLNSLWEVRTALYGETIRRPQMAGLAPLVFQACQQGDEAALRIVDQAAGDLAQLAAAVLGRLRWEEPPLLAPVGGVFQAGESIMDPFQTKLQGHYPGARVVPARYPPVIGALLLAYRAGQVRIEAGQLESVKQKIQKKG